MTPLQSSGLVPNLSPSTPFVPPSRTDWDILFQPLFDELLNPPSSVDRPTPEVIALIAEVVAPEPAASTGSPSSTTVDQDAPSPNVAHMNNDPFFGIPIPENNSEASSSSDVIPTIVQTAAPNSEHELIPRHDKVMVITLKWIYKVKLDELGGILNNKACLVACGYRQEEGINLRNPLALVLVARLDAIRIFLAFAAHMNMIVYQMDEPWIPHCSSEDKAKIFSWTTVFTSPKGIFLNQSKYALESLKKYGMESSDPVDTPVVEKSKLDEDTQGKAVDPTHYRGMVGTLMYLIASRPDLTIVVCMYAWYQAKPIVKYLHVVKRIFKYLRGTINRGLWYPKDSSITLTAYTDADHAGCQDTRRSTSRSMQLLGERLVSWSSKRQKSVAISSTEAEYIALSGCYAQVLWMRSQLTDFGLGFNKIPIYCDNKSAIALCYNNVQYSQSKHIDIRFHFIKENVKNGVVELYFVNTEY
ncbi:uncharacterized mitochondrial protein-like protein [Tanacetum coccineum]